MNYLLIFPSYFFWHYGEAFKDITRIWTNFIWFTFNFFSIPLLLPTFFSPWRRIREERVKGTLHLEDIAGVILTNTVMRLVGMFLRAIILLLGILFVFTVFWIGVCFYVVWIVLPVLVPLSLFYGLSILMGIA